MVHGEHWEAIAGDDELFAVRMVRHVVEKGELVGKNEFDNADSSGVPRRDIVTGIIFGGDAIRYLALVVSDGQTNEFASGYPVLAYGAKNKLFVREKLPEDDGIEGCVSATTLGGSSIRFADPYYFKNMNLYREGAELEFNVAGLAMLLRKAEQEKITIDKGPMIRIERERLLRDNPNADVSSITSVEVSMKGAVGYLPIPGCPGEGEFRTSIEEIEFFAEGGKDFCRIRAILHRDDEHPLVCAIFAESHVLKGYRPKVGDDIEGILWLQGYPSLA